jgi:hypothetical protein
MFANFDYTCFPLIKVNFNKLENNAEFDAFLKEWLSIYERRQYFSMIFNTTEMDFINPKYAIRISSFIKTLKKMPIQYLLFSILIMNNKILETLLKTVLSIQKPSAPLYITKCMEQSIEVYTKVIHGDKVLCPFFLPSAAKANANANADATQ